MMMKRFVQVTQFIRKSDAGENITQPAMIDISKIAFFTASSRDLELTYIVFEGNAEIVIALPYSKMVEFMMGRDDA